MKYKPGDKVVLRNERGACWNEDGHMDVFIGKTVTIRSINHILNSFQIIEDGMNYWAFSNSDIDEEATKKLNTPAPEYNDIWLNICELDWTEGTRYVDDAQGLIWEIEKGNLFMYHNKAKINVMAAEDISKMRFKKLEIDWSKVAVDTRIWVSSTGYYWRKRYFAKYENGRVFAFTDSHTSWVTDNIQEWEYVKLAEVDES